MDRATTEALLQYVGLLLNGTEHINAVHNTEVIPYSLHRYQFPDLSDYTLPQGITYDKPTGWFRKIPK